MKTILLTFMMVFGIAIVQTSAQSASAKSCAPQSCIKTGCTPEECAKLGMDYEKCKTMCATACKPGSEKTSKCSSSEFKVSSLLSPTLNTTKEENKMSSLAKVEISPVIE